MIQVTHPNTAIVTRTVKITDGTRPNRIFCKSVTAGVKTNANVSANVRGIRISRVKYNVATMPNTSTTVQALEDVIFRRKSFIELTELQLRTRAVSRSYQEHSSIAMPDPVATIRHGGLHTVSLSYGAEDAHTLG